MNIKDFKWTEKRFGTRFANILKNLIAVRKDSTETTLEYEDTQGNVTKLVTDSNFSSLLAKNGLIEVKWQELKDKRDNGQLIPGSLYRITDYQCTTTQENTRSAGHQFDIVLLALSEDKLAEEGWAMEHPTDVYDVTFNDDVTLKCYIYKFNEMMCNVVSIDTLKGVAGSYGEGEDVEINGSTAVANGLASTDLTVGNIPYNYFQNSNLSAWKVWYCLDNDKSRFAWADDASEESITINGYAWKRDADGDADGKFAWERSTSHIYTNSEHPLIGEMTYVSDGEGGYDEEDPITAVSGFGRGVIYRLIDEFNNDIKYDFKNIQFKRKLTYGEYDATNGTDTWCYTLNIWYQDMCQDASIVGNTLPNDEGYVVGVYDNNFGYTTAYDFYIEGVNTFAFALGDNVVLSFDDGSYYGIKSNIIGNSFNSNTIGNGFNSNTIGNYFYSNTIGDFFESNTIGSGFSANIIGNSFNGNTIGNYVSDNTIRDSFNANTIGNNFNNKTISDNTSYKNYGNNGVELATKS